jgi:hypothetical protein
MNGTKGNRLKFVGMFTTERRNSLIATGEMLALTVYKISDNFSAFRIS